MVQFVSIKLLILISSACNAAKMASPNPTPDAGIHFDHVFDKDDFDFEYEEKDYKVQEDAAYELFNCNTKVARLTKV